MYHALKRAQSFVQSSKFETSFHWYTWSIGKNEESAVSRVGAPETAA